MSNHNESPQAALDGRLPVLPHERIFSTYGSLLWTTAVLSAASYAYLIGSAFQSFGNARLAVVGYLIGLVLGEVLVALAVGIPSFRYGVDPVDVSKAALGVRGSVLLLFITLATCLGWAYVLMAMTARGFGRLVGNTTLFPGSNGDSAVVSSALALLLLLWLLVGRGSAVMERLAKICGMVQIAIALVILSLLIDMHGSSLFASFGPQPNNAITTDPLTQIAYGVEFGFDNALTLLPFLGGLTRLVRHERHVVGPTVVGSGLVGASLIAAVAALAAGVFSDPDPIDWILKLAGGDAGTAIVALVLVANIGTMVIQLYVAGLVIQQVRALAKWRWKWLIALTLTPGLIVAFNTKWLLAHVMNWLAYNGVMFVGLTSVMFTDFYLVKRQRLDAAHLYARRHQGRYWYSGGVNWVALAAIVCGACLYLVLFDPVGLQVHSVFRYGGAGIPAVVATGIIYLVGMKVRAFWRDRSRPVAGSESETHVLEVGL